MVPCVLVGDSLSTAHFVSMNYTRAGKDAIGVKLSLGEWNLRLHKQSPDGARTKRKLMFLTRVGGFRLCRRGF
jgi:hypothetical protein